MSLSSFNWRPSFWLLFSTVMMPALMCLAVGIMILIFYRAAWDVAFGVLVLCFSFFSVSGAVITTFILRKSAKLSRLEAEFLANMSHDFRTPLTSIRLFVETLRAGKIQDPDEKNRCLELLAQETTRMEELVQRVLTFRKIERGINSYHWSPINIKQIVENTLTPFRLNAEYEKRLQVTIAADLPIIEADSEALVEALRNLVSNAIKYSGSSPVIVSATCTDEHFLISVHDQGPVIPHAQRKKIFKRFYRIPGTHQSGSGLGLAIARHVALAHRGRLLLECGATSGNTFSIRLPVPKQNNKSAPQGEQHASS